MDLCIVHKQKRPYFDAARRKGGSGRRADISIAVRCNGQTVASRIDVYGALDQTVALRLMMYGALDQTVALRIQGTSVASMGGGVDVSATP